MWHRHEIPARQRNDVFRRADEDVNRNVNKLRIKSLGILLKIKIVANDLIGLSDKCLNFDLSSRV